MPRPPRSSLAIMFLCQEDRAALKEQLSRPSTDEFARGGYASSTLLNIIFADSAARRAALQAIANRLALEASLTTCVVVDAQEVPTDEDTDVAVSGAAIANTDLAIGRVLASGMVVERKTLCERFNDGLMARERDQRDAARDTEAQFEEAMAELNLIELCLDATTT